MKALSINKSKMVKVKNFNSEHSCPLKDGVHSDCRATSGLIGGIITPKRRNHKSKYIPNDIMMTLYWTWVLILTICWHIKQKRKAL